jgi:hypothetical protein
MTADNEFTALTVPFVANAVVIELANVALLPKAAAISANVFNCEGAPANKVVTFSSKYVVVAFKASPADNVLTLVFNASFTDCNEENEAEINPDVEATFSRRLEISVEIAVLIVVLDAFSDENANEAVVSIDATALTR